MRHQRSESEECEEIGGEGAIATAMGKDCKKIGCSSRGRNLMVMQADARSEVRVHCREPLVIPVPTKESFTLS